MALGMIRSDNGEHFDIYRDIMYAYLTIIRRFFAEHGIPKDAVSVEGGKKRNVSRAPHIVISREEFRHEPRSLMMNENNTLNEVNGMEIYLTKHVFDYPIGFTVSGNSYLEAEKLGMIAVESLLLTGVSGIRDLHPNIIGGELTAWTKSVPKEGEDSDYYEGLIVGKVSLIMEGIYDKLT